MNELKTIEDVVRKLGADDTEVIVYEKLLSVLPADSHTVKHHEAIMICKALNDGWVPDWNDDDQYKHTPWFYMGGSSGFRCLAFDYWLTTSHVGSRLCFKSAELAKHAGSQFTEVYKSFMTV